jgi:hypothetical protein
MQIDIPKPKVRDNGDYAAMVSKGYGDPHGTIALDENWEVVLDHLSVEDCDGLIKAAALIKEKVLAYRAEMGAPHGAKHLYRGRCQLCGKPEDDELHAEPKPPAHVCECGHFEAYHVGAVLGDPDPGQCTDDDCACERYAARPAQATASVTA